ncbi:MAG: alpha/beta fold hydrolase [Pirellulales bacterium]|nr:alpha/beta fold hydrolase [Pirellulales bacterium]
MRNRHIQTVLGIHWPRRDAPYRAVQHYVTLDDGDRLVLHEDASNGSADSQPIILLIHGLAGCHMSTYMCRMAERLVAEGYRVFRMDMRGCGAGEGLAKLPTHCGRSTDVAAALHHVAEIYPDADTSIVGYSMGGTMTMNLLAEAGEMRVGNLQRSFVICPPIELAHVERHFRTFWGRPYDRFFVRLLWKQITDRWRHFPDLAPPTIPKRPKRLRDIDQLVIAPSGGFDSAEHYYEQTSPGPKLASIKQPLTIFFSEDDPIVPIAPLFYYPRSSSVEVITSSHGGHLGFLARPSSDPDFRWLDWRILDWLKAGETRVKSREPKAAVEAV